MPGESIGSSLPGINTGINRNDSKNFDGCVVRCVRRRFHEPSASPMADRFSNLRWAHPATLSDYSARNHAHSQPWHGNFYYTQTGQPTALVVPPTAVMQQNYSWGVSQNTMTPIYSQYGRSAPIGGGGGRFYATPVWPSHTEQFGVYPVRAPW